ncbi:hypothetical protein V9T40_002544 [Parthenolecanium corni]|uniref:t-SNARE coiled-coil homology domain-containing protein n=1 Tax=Parthenolecanium corni TaxID=536013 RepID=A0AAN9TX84_9HEMI
MSLVIIDNDPWLVEHELMEKLEREIIDLLNKRSVELKSSDTYARLSSTIRLRLKQFDDEVQQLARKLREATISRSITLDEGERRERLIEQLKSKVIQLQRRFNHRDTMSQINRTEISNSRFGSSSNRVGAHTSGWSTDDDSLLPENPSQMDIERLRFQQRQIMKDQDNGLDELSKIISRQKDIAVKIGSEADTQNEIIDDISARMERTTTGLRAGTDHIHVVSMKDSTCGYWIIIILLFVAIIFVLLF